MTNSRPVPLAPKARPLVGHLVPLLRNPLEFLNSLPAHGDLVRIRLGPFTLVAICDPELTRRALVDDRVFDKGGPIFDRVREVVGDDGLASCPYSAHRRLRRLAQPAFHPARFPDYAKAMSPCIEDVADSWRAGQVLDVPTEMMTITSKVTAATLFSGALPAGELGPVLKDVKTFFDGFYQRMFMVPPLDRLPTPGNRSHVRACARLRDAFDQIIAQRRAEGVDHDDLLSALIMAHDAEGDGHGMTDAEISDTIVTFFLAGTETTAALLAWALDLLARHPRIERRLHAEVDTVLNGARATHADLPRLELTHRVITETLRLRPPGWIFTRTVTADTHLGGYRLPAGSSVVYSPYLIHHRPDLYDDPETFDPDRWDPERPQPPRHALLPFAVGARKCIGDTFGMTEAVLALATIAARWRLERLPGQQVRPALGLALRPRRLLMRATPRTDARDFAAAP
ncbi:cytochrome P450 [Streptomyces flavofungini]|uniref:Cytochrome P450 n=1 Tax=Streptomyces flavofungini TaxID=68200 RepID=A0ABS0WZC2_9ACTN|nr:cytochrome P450 [Streptomyces flavofungini]MBJ3806243.1 cytochrome P450 [Streptomyces flavofungini]GHC46421.1 cytochrome P450 [Streptomyces flavofungini]